MTCVSLEIDNREDVLNSLGDQDWVVACLCAAWCDSCREFRPAFEALARQHPEQRFLWIDIEDQADVVGDFDVENFPTILLQKADTVAFFGPVLPDTRGVQRLLAAQMEKTQTELAREAGSNAQRQQWQDECNLRTHLRQALSG
jgi:thioredoxin 1